MNRARAFFYVCAGLFLLALSYHLGARSATAQAGSMVTGFSTYGAGSGASNMDCFVITPNGDVFGRNLATGYEPGPLNYLGNFWSGGGPVPVERHTLGQLKARFRDPVTLKQGAPR